MSAVEEFKGTRRVVHELHVPPTGATEDLVHLYSGDVYRYCLRQLGSPEEAEDATQDTYLNAWRSIERGFRPRTPLAWLLRIAQNLCLSCHRARQARVQTRPIEGLDLPAGPPPSDELLALSEALAELSGVQRRALVMRE